MDTTALSLCMENDMPIRVFNVNDERNIVRVAAASDRHARPHALGGRRRRAA